MTSKRRKWFIALACVACTITLAVVLTRNDEPRYQGRTLSAWVLDLANNPSHTSDAIGARKAIQHIGTNAIPFLLDYLSTETEPSRLRNAVRWLLDRSPSFIRAKLTPLDQWTRADKRNARRNSVPMAFEALGPAATTAIPRLNEMMRDRSPTTGDYWMVVWSLATISTNAQQILLKELADPDPIRRGNAAATYVKFALPKSNAEPAVPLLVQALEGKEVDPLVGADLLPRLNAAAALGRIKVPPELVLPALTNALQDSYIAVRLTASNSILRITSRTLTNAPPE